MSSFTEFSAPLSIQYDHAASQKLGKDYWRVTEAFRFYVDTKDSGEWVYVHEGYLTDGASVPRIFWSLIPPWGQYGQAAVVHDILCEYLSTTLNGRPKKITRKECDLILLEAMTALGVPACKRQLIYQPVQLYRVVAGVKEPSFDPRKLELEREWFLARHG